MSELQGGLPDADRATEGDPVTNWHAHLDANGITYQHRHANSDSHEHPGPYGYADHYPNGDTLTVSDAAPDRDTWWRRVLRGLDPTAPR